MTRIGGITLKGDKALRKLLRDTPPQVLERAIAPAARRSMAPVGRLAKKRLTKLTQKRYRSGTLRKSIGTRSRRDKRRGTVWVGVGPRLNTKQAVTLSSGRVQMRDPVKYAHLVERGFRHHRGRIVRARSFLEASMCQLRPTMERQIASDLGSQIPKVAARLAAKHKIRKPR
jgi:hypothetical protein